MQSRLNLPRALDRPKVRKSIDFLTHDVWMMDVAAESRRRSAALKISRVLLLTLRGVQEHKSALQAAALTYYTVLSIVPVLALAFALARGLQQYDTLRADTIDPFIAENFGENPKLQEATDYLFSQVDQASGGAMGSLAILFLAWMAIKLMTAVEKSLNEVWGIKRGRSFLRRVTDYMAFLAVTPILLLGGTGLATWFEGKRTLLVGTDIGFSLGPFVSVVAPIVSIWLGLSFAFLALPNTRVRLPSALFGGALAALAWFAAQWIYVYFQVGLTKYNGIYGSFAALPVFLVWMYSCWMIFLVGAELTYAHQNVPLYTSIRRTGNLDQTQRESLALRLVGRIAHAFLNRDEPLSAGHLASELSVSPRAVQEVLEALADRGILARASEGREDSYLPARDPDHICVADVLEALRTGEGGSPLVNHGRLDDRVDRILASIDRDLRKSLSNYTLRELALASVERPPQQ